MKELINFFSTKNDDIIKISKFFDSISIYINTKTGAQILLYLDDNEAAALARSIQLARGES